MSAVVPRQNLQEWTTRGELDHLARKLLPVLYHEIALGVYKQLHRLRLNQEELETFYLFVSYYNNESRAKRKINSLHLLKRALTKEAGQVREKIGREAPPEPGHKVRFGETHHNTLVKIIAALRKKKAIQQESGKKQGKGYYPGTFFVSTLDGEQPVPYDLLELLLHDIATGRFSNLDVWVRSQLEQVREMNIEELRADLKRLFQELTLPFPAELLALFSDGELQNELKMRSKLKNEVVDKALLHMEKDIRNGSFQKLSQIRGDLHGQKR